MSGLESLQTEGTSLSWIEESTPKVANPAQLWRRTSPNSYSGFSREAELLERNIYGPDKQALPAIPISTTVEGGFNMDVTLDNYQDLVQGFFKADWRYNTIISSPMIVEVSGRNCLQETSPSFVVGDILLSDQRVLYVVNRVTSDCTYTTPNLPDTLNSLTLVGRRTSVQIDTSNQRPRLILASAPQLTSGAWIYLDSFSNDGNNGFVQVTDVDTTNDYIEVHKSHSPMEDETRSASIYYSSTLRNEQVVSRIVERTYQLELAMGEGVYRRMSGSYPSVMTLQVNNNDKALIDFSYEGLEMGDFDSPLSDVPEEFTDIASSSAVAETPDSLQDIEAVSNNRHMKRLAIRNSVGELLFMIYRSLQISLNHGIESMPSARKLGNSAIRSGSMSVEAEATVEIPGLQALQEVARATKGSMEIAFVKGSKGMIWEMPNIPVGGGSPSFNRDEPVQSTLILPGAKGEFGYTVQLSRFDYLPDSANYADFNEI